MSIEFPAFVVRSTFTRGSDVIVLDYAGPLEVGLTYCGAGSQVFRFSDVTTAGFFRADLERELLQDGWTIYPPEGSAGHVDGARRRRPVVFM